MVGSFTSVYLLFQKGSRNMHYDYRDLLRSMLETAPAEHIPLLILVLFSAACAFGIGMAGVMLMIQYRREVR
jgi:hypothetical protein